MSEPTNSVLCQAIPLVRKSALLKEKYMKQNSDKVRSILSKIRDSEPSQVLKEIFGCNDNNYGQFIISKLDFLT